jgi:CRISPR-associated protein Csm1
MPQKFLLKCDISGIQGFIFDVPSDGAARQLKARSFYVFALTEIAYEYFAQKVASPQLIYKGGGNFFAYFETEKEKLNEAIQNFQKEFLQENIFPVFAFVESKGEFREDMKKIAQKANIAKLQKPLHSEAYDFSPVKSKKWEEFTQDLVRSSGYVIKNDCQKNNPFSKAGFTFELREKDSLQFEGKVLNKMPTTSNGIVEFDEIAQNATGDKKLAALAMDVDNLGSLFRDKEEKDYKLNSQNLTDFFEIEIYNLLKDSIEKHFIYPVFSGGDDCFLVGAWDKILETACLIQNNFQNFVKDKNLPNTLSAGVVIVSPKFPMVRMAEEAENALKTAKNNGKNGICIFGEVLRWNEFEQACKIAYELKRFVEADELPRNILHRLQSSELGFTSLQEQKAGKINFPRVHRLKYYLRNIDKNAPAHSYLEQLFENYKNALLTHFLKKPNAPNPALYVVAARWAELLTKSANKES